MRFQPTLLVLDRSRSRLFDSIRRIGKLLILQSALPAQTKLTQLRARARVAVNRGCEAALRKPVETEATQRKHSAFELRFQKKVLVVRAEQAASRTDMQLTGAR